MKTKNQGRIEKEKESILQMVKDHPMTVKEIARDLDMLVDTVYNRIRSLREEKKPIHVCGWRVSFNTMTRVFGYGTNADASRPGFSKTKIFETEKQQIFRRYPPIPHLENHKIWDMATYNAVRGSV